MLLELRKSLPLLVNALFLLLGMLLPQTKDLLGPDLELAIATLVNAAILFYLRLKDSGSM